MEKSKYQEFLDAVDTVWSVSMAVMKYVQLARFGRPVISWLSCRTIAEESCSMLKTSPVPNLVRAAFSSGYLGSDFNVNEPILVQRL